MTDYSSCNVSYKPQLPTQIVTLPLKYPSKSTGGTNLTVADDFVTKISSTGQFIHTSSFIDTIVVDLLNDNKTLTLLPINSPDLNLQLQKVVVELPTPIINQCFSVNCIENGTKDPDLIIDLIDENYLFITVIVNLTQFINGSSNLKLDNFKNWGNITVPYSFELRSSPFFFKSLNAFNFIVSLKDGGLLHFKRGKVLEDFDIYNFNSTKPNLFNWFKKTDNDNYKIVDLVLNKDELITLTANKELKFWDLQNHELKSSISLINNNYLNPGILFKQYNDIVIFHVTNSFEIDHFVTFYIFENGQLTNFQVNLPLKLWFIQDFEFVNDKLFILWKSNTTTMLVEYHLNEKHETINTKTQYLTSPSPLYPHGFNIDDLKYYDSLILTTAINTVREKLGLSLVSTIESLTDPIINETVGKLDKPWLIYSICQEYNTIGHEGLRLGVFNDQILILQTNGLGYIRPLSYFEKFTTQDNDLAKFIHKIDLDLSMKTIGKVYDYLLTVPSIDSDTLSTILDLTSIRFESLKEITHKLNTNHDLLQLFTKILKATDESSGKLSELNVLEKAIFIQLFRDLSNIHKIILTKLIILLSHLDTTSDLPLKLTEQMYHVLRNIDAINTIDFNYIVPIPLPHGILEKYDYLLQTINDEQFLLDLIVTIIQEKKPQSFVYKILDSIRNQYLIGLVYLMNNDEQAFKYLTYENYLESKLDFQSLGLLEFKPSDESEYYHELCKLISSKFPQQAIDYELKAIELSNNVNYYETLFKLTVPHFDYQNIIKSLEHLLDHDEFKIYLKTTILKVIDQNSTKELFQTSIFSENYSLVDLILVEIIENLDLISSIKFFEILYSWRIHHGDKRHALEALHQFIRNFKSSSIDLSSQDSKLIHLKILEFYLVILNGLKSFNNVDEKWLMTDNLTTLTEINHQYTDYLQKLTL